MNTAFLLSALTWLKTNWQGCLAGLALGLALMALNGLVAPNKPLVEASAGASQSLSGTAQASSGAVIEIPGRPATPCPESNVCPECPPVRIVYDCKATVSGGASSVVSASAKIEASKGIPIGLVFGPGYRSDSSIDLSLGVRLGNWSIDAQSNSVGAYRLGATWTYWFN